MQAVLILVRTGRLLSLLVAAALVCLGAPDVEAKIRVVTTIETFADLARKIGGDRVEAQSLGRGYMDPHFVESKPHLIVVLNRADLLIRVGLDLEIGWLPPLVLSARNARIQLGMPGNLDASQTIAPLDVLGTKPDRAMGDIHPQGNPHYWIPPDNALVVAHEIAGRLKQIDPPGGATYDQNLKSFAAALEQRRAGWERAAAALRGTKIVTYHKSWSYVSRWLGLLEVGYIEPKPGIPPAPSHVVQLIGAMQREGARVVLTESFYPRNTVDLVAQKAGARVVAAASDVNGLPDTGDYFALVDSLLKALGTK